MRKDKVAYEGITGLKTKVLGWDWKGCHVLGQPGLERAAWFKEPFHFSSSCKDPQPSSSLLFLSSVKGDPTYSSNDNENEFKMARHSVPKCDLV